MITREQCEAAVLRDRRVVERAGIVITPPELDRLEEADFGLNAGAAIFRAVGPLS